MGRVTDERRAELEERLCVIAQKLEDIAREIGCSIHLDANYRSDETSNISAFVHYHDEKKLAYGITSRINASAEELKGVLTDSPEWYTKAELDRR